MAFVLRQIIIKPNYQTKWFGGSGKMVEVGDNNVLPAVKAVADLSGWIRAQDGYVETFGRMLDKNSIESVYIFRTPEQGSKFMEDREKNPIYVAQQLYFAENGISVNEFVL